MKKVFLLLLFILSTTTFLAQSDSITLKNIIDTTKNQDLKLQYLDSLAKINSDNTNAFVAYSKRYIQLAEKLGYYDKAIRKGNRIFYSINNLQNRRKEALRLIEHLQQYENQVKDSFLIGNLYLKKGGAYYGVDYDLAIENYTKAIEKFGQKDSIYVADAYLFNGQAKSFTGDFVNAINDYETASVYYEALNDISFTINAKIGISIIYSMNGFYENAKQVRDDIKDFSLKNEAYGAIVASLVNQATDYKKQGMFNEQEATLLEALTINTDKNQSELFRDVNINTSLVKFYSKKGDRIATKKHLDNLEKRIPEFNNNPEFQHHYYQALSSYQKLMDMHNLALSNMIKVNDMIVKMKNKDLEVEIKRELAELYELNNLPKKSYETYKEYTRLKDSVFNISKTNTLLYYETLYETERKEKELVTKEASIQLLKKDSEIKNRVLLLTIVGLSLLFTIIYLYRNKLYLIRSKQLQEGFSQQLLAHQEDERKRISKDLHDGLGQSLLLIKNKIVLSEDENTKSMVNNVIEEVRSISKALHPFQLEELGLTKAIENIINQLDEHTDIFISSEIESVEGLFSPEQEVNIFRIVQESLNNIIKHADAKAAKIEIQKTKKQIHLIIKDNGKGFDFSKKYNDFSSLGLKTLKERTKFLEGTMKVDSEKNKGTKIEFIIPFK
ncbi:hypothetical protein GTQ40_14395 [Flavobacteriaceae bacterium R38]|nr:hypothetical protein [Flavobacteriaceae bacterium R38]